VCVRYFDYKIKNQQLCIQFLRRCLISSNNFVVLAAIITSFYEEQADPTAKRDHLIQALLRIVRQLSVDELFGAIQRGGLVTARSREVPPFVSLLNDGVRMVPQENTVNLDFNAILSVAAHFIGRACVLEDVVEQMDRIWKIRFQSILEVTQDREERL